MKDVVPMSALVLLNQLLGHAFEVLQWWTLWLSVGVLLSVQEMIRSVCLVSNIPLPLQTDKERFSLGGPASSTFVLT